ncbi:lipoprotein [Polaromonas sp.]|uniref:LPS translocon maturation chaperone LptM n=1 Tax=Polaromonas sp. TaxID=1869339 RepID=UPI0034550901
MVFLLQILDRLQAAISRHSLFAVVAVAVTLVGCGQKGPLFIRVPPSVQPASLPTAIPAVLVPLSPASATK